MVILDIKMETEAALPPKSLNVRSKVYPLLLTFFVFILGMIVGAVSLYSYFSFLGKFEASDYSKINWFGNSKVTPTVTVFENPFSQGGGVTPSVSPNPSVSPTVSPSASPTYINPFDLIGQ